MSEETIIRTVDKWFDKRTKTEKTRKTKTKKPKKTKKKRPIPWKAIQKLVDSPKSPEAPKKAFRKALKYHNQGLTDNEVRKKMGWNK